jgi:hypothetical protein
MIELLKQNHYVISDYLNHHQHTKVCILRHDIDYDLNKALEMAIFESENRVKSTYFILMSSDFYNVFSKRSLSVIKKIHSLGHEIGLHFDETKYEIHNQEKFIKYAEDEMNLLKKITGLEIHAISMHRPSQLTLQSNYKFISSINSYSFVFFRDFKYLSDSRMNWKKNVLDIISSNSYNKLHILIHPFWYSQEPESTKAKILAFIHLGNFNRFNFFTENFTDLNEFVSKDEIK